MKATLWVWAVLLPVCLSADIYSAKVGTFGTASEAQKARAPLSADAVPYCVLYAEQEGYSVRCLAGSDEAAVRSRADALGLHAFETVAGDPEKVRRLFVERIHELVRMKTLPAAYGVSRMLYDAFPRDEAVLEQYATLLFWSDRPEEAAAVFRQLAALDARYADNKVYLQVRTTLLLQKGEAALARSPGTVPTLIDAEPEAVRNAYDVMLLRVRALMRLEKFAEAEAADRALLQHYPKSEEAETILSNLLTWQGKYAEAIAQLERQYARTKSQATGKKLAVLYLKAGETDKAAALLETLSAAQPRDLETTELYVASLLRNRDRSKAGAVVSDLDGESLKRFRETYPDLYCRAQSYAFEVGTEMAGYTDGRDDDGRAYLRLEAPIARTILVATAERVWRYGLYDTNFRGELYGAFGNGTWGYLTFSAGPDAQFLPLYSLGAHLFKDIGNFELGMGYAYSHYQTTDTQMLIPEYSVYFGGNYTWNQKFYWVPKSNSYALQNLLKYESACRWSAQLSYTRASSTEAVDIGNVFSHSDADMFRGEATYRFGPSWLAGAVLFYDSYTTDTATFGRRGGDLYIRRYW